MKEIEEKIKELSQKEKNSLDKMTELIDFLNQSKITNNEKLEVFKKAIQIFQCSKNPIFKQITYTSKNISKIKYLIFNMFFKYVSQNNNYIKYFKSESTNILMISFYDLTYGFGVETFDFIRELIENEQFKKDKSNITYYINDVLFNIPDYYIYKYYTKNSKKNKIKIYYDDADCKKLAEINNKNIKLNNEELFYIEKGKLYKIKDYQQKEIFKSFKSKLEFNEEISYNLKFLPEENIKSINKYDSDILNNGIVILDLPVNDIITEEKIILEKINDISDSLKKENKITYLLASTVDIKSFIEEKNIYAEVQLNNDLIPLTDKNVFVYLLTNIFEVKKEEKILIDLSSNFLFDVKEFSDIFLRKKEFTQKYLLNTKEILNYKEYYNLIYKKSYIEVEDCIYFLFNGVWFKMTKNKEDIQLIKNNEIINNINFNKDLFIKDGFLYSIKYKRLDTLYNKNFFNNMIKILKEDI